jgi:hypothetical protein
VRPYLEKKPITKRVSRVASSTSGKKEKKKLSMVAHDYGSGYLGDKDRKTPLCKKKNLKGIHLRIAQLAPKRTGRGCLVVC